MRPLSLSLLLLAMPLLAGAEEALLRLQGSNTIGAKLAPELAKAWLVSKGYQELHETEIGPEELRLVATARSGQAITVKISSHGSSTAFSGLAERSADIGMSSRPIKDEEVASLREFGAMDSPAAEHVVGLDGIAVIVHPGNALAALDMATVRDIFAGKISNWAQLGGPSLPINVYARDDKSGTYDTFKSLVLGKEAKLVATAHRFESNADLSDSVAADTAGIGFVGLPYVRKSKALAVADEGTTPIIPAAFSVATEDYVLARRLFLYVPPGQTNRLVREFAEFAQSAAGQRVVERVGFVSQNIIAGPVVASSEGPEEYHSLIKQAQRLSLNIRFRAGSAVLDSKAHRDLERLLRYLQESKGQVRLLLLGFADHNEVLPYHSYGLSVERADLVADLLLKHGVAATRVRGYGSALPVASNDTATGRQKNRRVEVWIEQRS